MAEKKKRDQMIALRLTKSGLNTIDRLRGEVSRSEYIRQALEAHAGAGRRGVVR